MRVIVPTLLCLTVAAVGGMHRVSAQVPVQPRDPHATASGATVGTGTIQGRITAADTGAPVRGAGVTAVSAGRLPLSVESGADGRYLFKNLPPGEYHVAASPRHHQVAYLQAGFGGRTAVTGGKDGEFTLRGLREGRYYVTAISADELAGALLTPDAADPQVFGLLKRSATEVALVAGETRRITLRAVPLESNVP